MAVFPVVKGKKLRATKINNCGLPQAGEANFIVTDGFVTAAIDPVMNEAEELEQKNAEGKVCVTDRTPPERKWYTITVELCQVNTGLIAMFSGWEQILDYLDNPVGFQDQKEVDDQFGVALEIWTGGRSEEDCPVPESDDIFEAVGASGLNYGYLLIGGVEWTLSGLNIGAQVSTFTLTGRSIAMPQWGRGPWNVVPIDNSLTPGRLLTPLNKDSHFRLLRTPIDPPEETDGVEPQPLAIKTLFQDPDFYFGGPAGEPAAAVAPSQYKTVWTVTLGSPSAGNWTLEVEAPGGTPADTANIAHNAAASAVASALAALASLEPSDVTVTGSAGGPYTVTLPPGFVLAGDGTGLTGGAFSVDQVS